MTNDSLPVTAQSPRPKREWYVDSRLLDIQVVVKGVIGDTSFKRPWLTMIVDDKGHIRGMQLNIKPPDDSVIADVMRSIFNSEDGPKELWIANGNDFQTMHSHEKHQISFVSSEPHTPRDRGKIERVFRNLDQVLPAFHLTQEHDTTSLTLEELCAATEDFMRQNNIRDGQPESGLDIKGDA